jgi:hypothetical protein
LPLTNEYKTNQNIGANLSEMAKAASVFLQTLSEKQKAKIQFGLMKKNATTGIISQEAGKVNAK